MEKWQLLLRRPFRFSLPNFMRFRLRGSWFLLVPFCLARWFQVHMRVQEGHDELFYINLWSNKTYFQFDRIFMYTQTHLKVWNIVQISFSPETNTVLVFSIWRYFVLSIIYRYLILCRLIILNPHSQQWSHKFSITINNYYYNLMRLFIECPKNLELKGA